LPKKCQKDFNMHVHSNEGDVIKMHQNIVTIVLMRYTLSKLYVDIKFDMFNVKFKDLLFYLPMEHYIIDIISLIFYVTKYYTYHGSYDLT
jgi:hypothetical protein